MHQSLGRQHLKISNLGSTIAYLFVQKYNLTTLVTHITNLYNLYKDCEDFCSMMAMVDLM